MSASRSSPAAAVVCGTHTAGLLVVAADGTPIHRESRVTRLGDGLAVGGLLTPSAIGRTAAALEEFRIALDRLRVGAVRVAATSAARHAANREELLWTAERAIGVRPQVLNGDEEARLSFRSATARLDAGPATVLVVDIGGGSTELAAGPARGRPSEPRAVRSVPVGCVAIAETLMRGDPPTCRALGRTASSLARRLTRVVRETPGLEDGALLMLLAGAAAGAADVRARIVTGDDGRAGQPVLTIAAVEEILRERLRGPHRNSGHGQPRTAAADVMVGGTLILLTIMRCLGFERCLLSQAELLDGLAASAATPIAARGTAASRGRRRGLADWCARPARRGPATDAPPLGAQPLESPALLPHGPGGGRVPMRR